MLKKFFILFWLGIWSPFVGLTFGHFITISLKQQNYHKTVLFMLLFVLYALVSLIGFRYSSEIFKKIKNLLTFERRCTGHCCKAFILPWLTPSEFERRKKLYDSIKTELNEKEKEELYVLNMIEYLGSDPIKFPEASQKVIPINNFWQDKQRASFEEDYRSHYYTCKHHCSVTGNCLDYENRPNMCKIFPHNTDMKWNGACIFRGCTKRYTLNEMIRFWFNKSKSFCTNFTFNWKYKYKRKIFKYIPEPIRVRKCNTRDFDIQIRALQKVLPESLDQIKDSDNASTNICSEIVDR